MQCVLIVAIFGYIPEASWNIKRQSVNLQVNPDHPKVDLGFAYKCHIWMNSLRTRCEHWNPLGPQKLFSSKIALHNTRRLSGTYEERKGVAPFEGSIADQPSSCGLTVQLRKRTKSFPNIFECHNNHHCRTERDFTDQLWSGGPKQFVEILGRMDSGQKNQNVWIEVSRFWIWSDWVISNCWCTCSSLRYEAMESLPLCLPRKK